MALAAASSETQQSVAQMMHRWEEWRRKAEELKRVRDQVVEKETKEFELLQKAQADVIAAVRDGDDAARATADAVYRELEARWKDVNAQRTRVQLQLNTLMKERDEDPDPALTVGHTSSLGEQRRQPFNANAISLQKKPLSRATVPQVPPEADENIAGLPVTDAALQRLFASFDSNDNGFLSWEEFGQVYGMFDNCGIEYNERKVKELLRKHNIMGDGKITYNEFCLIILSVHQR